MKMRSLTVLGSTGSIGRQTLEVAAQGGFEIVALAAGNNVDALIEQAKTFKPKYVAIADESKHAVLKDALPGIKICTVLEAGQTDADMTMAAIVGTAGLAPTMEAVKRGKTVAFASKECLVAAGPLMMDAVKKYGTTFLPVDSEHNAIFQVLNDGQGVSRIVLTASGGPFREWDAAMIASASVEQALAHPTWKMGPKISVDSASLMNKALEVIEAHHLFALPSEKIDVVFHPQSIVHGMVEYDDGSFLAQLGPADMRTPISVCMAWPRRMTSPGQRLDLSTLSRLDFAPPDIHKFPALRLVRDVLAGVAADSIIFNAANEVAVAAFLAKNISFGGIVDTVGRMLDTCHKPAINSLDDVYACDDNVRRTTQDSLKKVA
jgi:1-deoxy-D-xylulose-5-phosphate reductoisomerase